jgi:hypothetical protein
MVEPSISWLVAGLRALVVRLAIKNPVWRLDGLTDLPRSGARWLVSYDRFGSVVGSAGGS